MKKLAITEIPNDFKILYKELYNTHIYNLEKLRKRIKIINIISYSLLTIGILILLFKDIKYIPFYAEGKLVTFSLIMIFISVSIIILNNNSEKGYTIIYKKNIISNFIKLINNNINYNYIEDTKKTNEYLYRYKDAEFDDKYFNMFNANDYTEGYITENIFIGISDLNIQNRIKRGRRRSAIFPVFEGIFVYSECNKNINSIIKVIRKEDEKIESSIERINLNNEIFEKKFTVYAEDESIARSIFKDKFIETLINFHDKYNLDFEITLKNNNIYLRFYAGGMFEPSIYKNSMDKEILFRYYVILNFIIEVTKSINEEIQKFEFNVY